MCAELSLAIIGALVLMVYLAKRFFRRNCHFCDSDVYWFGLSSSWLCPHCEGYNGFTSDGGYDDGAPVEFTAVIAMFLLRAHRGEFHFFVSYWDLQQDIERFY